MRNRRSSLPIAKNEPCPGLLTTKNSWFENYATQKENDLAPKGAAVYLSPTGAFGVIKDDHHSNRIFKPEMVL